MPETIVPFTPPLAPTPEPEAVLRFGAIEVRLGLTYLHHLVNCQGWGDRASSYYSADRVMQDAVQQIERAMWAETDKRTGGQMSTKLDLDELERKVRDSADECEELPLGYRQALALIARIRELEVLGRALAVGHLVGHVTADRAREVLDKGAALP